MILKDIFLKPVERYIEGVVKADDEKNIKLELEEYVLTNEIENQLGSFLNLYNNYSGSNGVWISGFFGSGKSHLLKILAFLLENRIIDDKPSIEYFKPKLNNKDEFLKSDLVKACKIPCKNILFNIDQKADVISKDQIDALLAVFVKVFDEMCGYYGKHGYVAQFERDLDNKNLYEQFKTIYKEISGEDWQSGRETAILDSDKITDAYSKVASVSKEAAHEILEKYRQHYKVSIEDFAEMVKKYIDKQGKDFRLNFFVDEVGQYIANNTKLMTNLQTIAETLATKCNGHSWLFVTAQEDMESVIGEMTFQQGNDFSKIQDRFKIRMKLTSADVAEVIQKRLLLKNDNSCDHLSRVYEEQKNNFKTLFDFVDDSTKFKNYKDKEHFTNSYPFVPYQYELFQQSIKNLSIHNAFTGKHSSIGERSMLGVFQEVVLKIKDTNIGQLATFDLMFEGIRNVLNSKIQSAIILAENNLGNDFAVKVLKSLFLVKYVKGFKSTLPNICNLLLDSFTLDIPKLKTLIEETLDLLERQTYIQRNGKYFEFLTNEEKDIEQEIKNTSIDIADIIEEMNKTIFDGILGSTKIRYEVNKQDYKFSRKIDDKLQSKDYELSINVITPFSDDAGNIEMWKMQSMARDELYIIMPPDKVLVSDLMMYKKIEKYIMQNMSNSLSESTKNILEDKRFKNNQRINDIKQSVSNLLTSSTMVLSGSTVDINTGNPQTRIIKAFNELVTRTYPNLKMLHGVIYSENDIIKYIKQSDNVLSNDPLSEAEQEMLSRLNMNKQKGLRTSVKNLIEIFEKKPYGWNLAAILCIIAKLYNREKVEITIDSNELKDEELEKALRNTAKHSNLLLEPQIEYTTSQIRNLKQFYTDFFDEPPRASEAKALAKETIDKFIHRMKEFEFYKAENKDLPFTENIDTVIKNLKEYTTKSYKYFYNEFRTKEAGLYTLKEFLIDPLTSFLNGPQKEIFDNAISFIQKQAPNLNYIDISEVQTIKDTINDSECFNGNKIQTLKPLLEKLEKKISEQITEERNKALDTLITLKERMMNMDDYPKLNNNQKEELNETFEKLKTSIESQTIIAVIRDSIRVFEEKEFHNILIKIDEWTKPKPTKGGGNGGGTPTPEIKTVSIKSIKIHYSKPSLNDDKDIQDYIDALKNALLKEINEGKRINI